MSSSVALPQAVAAAPVDETERDFLHETGFVRLDGVEIANGNRSDVVTFDPDHHISGAWHYADGIGMVVHRNELWFWFGPRNRNFDEAVELTCPRGQKGRMQFPIRETTFVNALAMRARLQDPDLNP